MFADHCAGATILNSKLINVVQEEGDCPSPLPKKSSRPTPPEQSEQQPDNSYIEFVQTESTEQEDLQSSEIRSAFVTEISTINHAGESEPISSEIPKAECYGILFSESIRYFIIVMT